MIDKQSNTGVKQNNRKIRKVMTTTSDFQNFDNHKASILQLLKFLPKQIMVEQFYLDAKRVDLSFHSKTIYRK